MKRRSLLSVIAILFLLLSAAGPSGSVQALAPALSITKSTSTPVVSTGGTVVYTITTTNTGTAPALTTRVEDTLPFEGLWSEDSDQCQVRFGFLLQCELGTLDPGESHTVTVTGVVSSAVCGVINNQAAAFAAGVPKVFSNTVGVTVGNCVTGGLVLNKTAGQASVPAGSTLTFILRVTNTSTKIINGVTISDPLPAGIGWSENAAECSIDGATNLLTCDFGSLAVGASGVVTLTGQTTPSTCGVVTNTASASGSGVSTVTASASVDVVCEPANLSLVKIAQNDSIGAGETLRYQLEVSNTGAGTVVNARISDTLPTTAGLAWVVESVSGGGSCAISGGVLSCSMGDLPAGVTRTVVLASSTTSASCGLINNTATATSDTPEGDLSDNTASDSVQVRCGELVIDKEPLAAQLQAGGEIGFIITVRNTGEANLTNVQINDPLPAAFTWTETSDNCSLSGDTLACTIDSLAPGEEVSVTVTAPSTPAQCGAVANTASATATGVTTPVTDTATTTLLCTPELTLDKMAVNPLITAGQPIVFDLIVTNAGGGAAQGVTLLDPLPTGPDLSWSFSNVSAGGSCSITNNLLSCSFGTLAAGATAQVRVSSPSGPNTCGQVSNTATATATNDPNAPSDIDLVEVLCDPNLTLEKTAPVAAISAGSTARFEMTVTSNGNATVNDVTLTDTLPTDPGLVWTVESVTGGGTCAIAGSTLTCSFGSLAPGQTRTVVISAQTSTDACASGIPSFLLQNAAHVSGSNEPLGRQGDNTDSATITVNCLQADCVPIPIYVNNFDSINPGPDGWSSYPITNSPNNLQTFLGEFNNDQVRLTVTDNSLEGHNFVRVSYDFYAIRTWDGNTDDGIRGPDRFEFTVRNEADALLNRPLDTTFSNIDNWPFRPAFDQAFPGYYPESAFPPFTGALEIRSLGYVYAGPRDSVYRVSHTIPHTLRDVRLLWEGFGLQPIDDESWGLDNLTVEIFNCPVFFELHPYYLPVVAGFSAVLGPPAALAPKAPQAPQP